MSPYLTVSVGCMINCTGDHWFSRGRIYRRSPEKILVFPSTSWAFPRKNEIHDWHPPRIDRGSVIGPVASNAGAESKHPLCSLPLQPPPPQAKKPSKSMCGIVAVHGLENPASERQKYIACSKKIRHRGPDWSGCYVGQRSILVHERLAIVGVGEYASYIFDMVN